METRRKFLNDSVKLLAGGLAILVSGGCEDRRYSYRDDKIKALQKSAKDYLTYRKYVPGEGYPYDINVPGVNGEKEERAHVNLSKAYFKEHKNLLKYNIKELSVRVYQGGTIEAWSGNIYVTDQLILDTAQKKTDKVLAAMAEENNRLREIKIKELLKDFRF